MILGRRRALTASQQFLNLQSHPLSAGFGELHAGAFVWRCEVTPSPLSRFYRLRIEFREGETPEVFVESPDLRLLAEGRRLPHVYRQDPPRLCLYLPRTYEWQPWMRIDATIVPWAILWLFYYEEWLASDEWKGGGEHPDAPEVETRTSKRRRAREGSPSSDGLREVDWIV
ncbi:MAG: hypothetical protein J0H42_20590 [Rhizobiales bacterium]|nr:hypothetical protein [Hyphomicrobiales bacterium]